jgi:hypothetical protein
VILDVISGQNLVAVVTLNIPKAVDLTGMGVSQFFAAVQKKVGSSKIWIRHRSRNANARPTAQQVHRFSPSSR